MSRKDYIAIAAAIRTAWTPPPGANEDITDIRRDTAGQIARSYASIARRDNPNFDRSRFLAACGVEG